MGLMSFCILSILFKMVWFRSIVLNPTFNNISVISWRSVLLVETHDLSQVTYNVYHIMLYRAHLTCAGFEPTMLVVIGTKTNYQICAFMSQPKFTLNNTCVFIIHNSCHAWSRKFLTFRSSWCHFLYIYRSSCCPIFCYLIYFLWYFCAVRILDLSGFIYFIG